MVELFGGKLFAQMATYVEISLLWKTMGGNDFGSISSSNSSTGMYEIFINMDRFQISQLQQKQIEIIWNYFRYLSNVYPNASLHLFEKGDHAKQYVRIKLS